MVDAMFKGPGDNQINPVHLNYRLSELRVNLTT